MAFSVYRCLNPGPDGTLPTDFIVLVKGFVRCWYAGESYEGVKNGNLLRWTSCLDDPTPYRIVRDRLVLNEGTAYETQWSLIAGVAASHDRTAAPDHLPRELP